MINARQLIKLLIREIFKEDNNFEDKPRKKSRRYIPPTLEVPKNLIKTLNNTSNGPHLKIINNEETGEKVIIISALLKIALEQSQRGRTSRDTELNKNRLLKRFDEIFEGFSMFKVTLKKSLENTKSRETPWGTFFTSRLIVSSSTPNSIIIDNPSLSGMTSGLDEKIK
jgi:hypothetical protein